ncbi:hypothetical protein [Amycolatopsis cihanbeyliensis]|uniref:Uncharacterized protein n=1 Tax=Amycolatopsis cihanbeyliensis TaxID=1128664 RepID=A0A542DN63_AMYCI|nr:hypothetical protein [Amycolatopsis cihanbeyliensis]TQJ04425.1 hypothetical protein FB471_4219 [Amycolatopsis cihanbeyliensis]
MDPVVSPGKSSAVGTLREGTERTARLIAGHAADHPLEHVSWMT